MGAAGLECPQFILTTIYLIRISSLAAAFISLFYKEGRYSNQDVIKCIQVILAGQALSCAPIVYSFMDRHRWPKPNWALIIIETAKGVTSAIILIGFTFCTIILIGAPLNNLRSTLELSCAMASLALPVVLVNYSLSSFGQNLRLIDRLMLTSLSTTAEGSFVKVNLISISIAAWVGGMALYLDWQDHWKVYPVANILFAIVMSIICNCIYLSHSTMSLVQKWTNY